MKENLTIGRRLEELGCPPGLQSEMQMFGLLLEHLTNQAPAQAKRNLANLRTDFPPEGGISFPVPRTLTVNLENALRAGDLGDQLKAAYIAGLMQAEDPIQSDEIDFVKQYYQNHQNFDLGSFTWGR